MRFLIVGCNGNMGKRYRRIFEYLGIALDGIDIGFDSTEYEYHDYDGVIYATPTANHLDDIKNHCGKSTAPILVEKPISKSAVGLEIPDCRIMMINQYRHLINPVSKGQTFYDFFKTGSDGLEWDCINIVGLAKSEISLSNTSPIWKCQINGVPVNIRDMDEAYIAEISRFIQATRRPFDWDAEREYIFTAHSKVVELIERGYREN